MERSPIYFISKINFPIIIIHGKNDKRVSIKEAINLSNELKKLKKKYKLN